MKKPTASHQEAKNEAIQKENTWAFNLLPWQLPKEIDGDDVTCIDFWYGEGCKSYTIGKGSTASEAIEDLERQIDDGAEKK